jgi:hypothetical protein
VGVFIGANSISWRPAHPISETCPTEDEFHRLGKRRRRRAGCAATIA